MSDTLVVVSKVKAFIKSNGELNTAASVADALTELVKRECLKAIGKAKADGRKTVMDRDFPSEGSLQP